MTTTTLTIDSETYVRKGVNQPGMTCQQWADEFHRLGGQKCTVTFPWVRNGTANIAFEGTDEALDFVRASVAEVG